MYPQEIEDGTVSLHFAFNILNFLLKQFCGFILYLMLGTHPGDVNVDIVLHALQNTHVGLDTRQQLAGLGNLTRLRAEHHHA